MRQFKLGDVIEKALKAVGITEERVTKVLGQPCGCSERKERMNRLSLWAARVVTGKTEDAEKYLDEILQETERKQESGEKSAKVPETNGGRQA